ncbi:MAG: asparagine synthase (glutamine-hydrolyzing) [Bacteroidetes bacterium]|nr:asparagine synthase (glutamine-hydrolyzing) [Bacteroidota bacterium]
MCRIAGMVNAASPANVIEASVQQMCRNQEHGGPDDGGTFVSETDHLVLGNRRLALLDLSADGHMPMQYNNRYWITYNGELYNFQELRAELILLNHRFKSTTDTEVILAAFAQWGTLSFSRLKGMFAFALWDSVEKEIYLVRDPSGIKPLYYHASKGLLCFASEIRAFKNIPGLQSANSNWPVYLMAYGFIPEPVTTLSTVSALPKGCYLKYSVQSGDTSLQSFKHYSYANRLTDPHEVNHSIRKVVDDSVKRQLVADAPLGVFLSGGLDSGIMASVASKYKKTDLNTLSIYFDDPAYSEKKYQDILHTKLQCRHSQYLLTEEIFHKNFEEIIHSMDMPSCDGINTWFISRHAKSLGLKAVLSGLGGDELFGGYPSFNRIATALKLQQLPSGITIAGRKSASKKLNRMSYLSMEGIKGIYLFLRGHFSAYEIARQLGSTEKEVWAILNETPIFNDIKHIHPKNQASWMEFNVYMQNQLLRDSDVMSMIHSVEIRVPFLDEDVIDLAFQIDPNVKYAGSNSKQILINCFNDILPREIWDRPKMGFSFPFQQWLRTSNYVKEIMQNGSKRYQESYTSFMSGKLHWSHLLSLVLIKSKATS